MRVCGGGERGRAQAGRQPGRFPASPAHGGWADSRAERKTRRQGNQSETNRFPLEVRKSRCCGCWWPVRLPATSLPSQSHPPPLLWLPTSPPTAFVRGPAGACCLGCGFHASFPCRPGAVMEPRWACVLWCMHACVCMHVCVCVCMHVCECV